MPSQLPSSDRSVSITADPLALSISTFFEIYLLILSSFLKENFSAPGGGGEEGKTKRRSVLQQGCQTLFCHAQRTKKVEMY